MWKTILTIAEGVSYQQIKDIFVDKIKSINVIDTGQAIATFWTKLTGNKKDDAIAKIVNPRIDAIQAYVKANPNATTRDIVFFAGQQAEALGIEIQENADQF